MYFLYHNSFERVQSFWSIIDTERERGSEIGIKSEEKRVGIGWEKIAGDKVVVGKINYRFIQL